MGGIGGEAEILGQREHLELSGPDPLPPQLDHVLGTLTDRVVEGPAPDPVPRLEHPHLEPGGGQLTRRGQPGEARTDDNDVTVMHRSKYPASAIVPVRPTLNSFLRER